MDDVYAVIAILAFFMAFGAIVIWFVTGDDHN